MFARPSVWKCLRRCTFLEVVYTKSASKMTTYEEKTEVQPRQKNLPCQISVTIIDCTVVTLWQRFSQNKALTPYYKQFRNSPSKGHFVKIKY
jgi:hypothetical protein